MSAPLEPTIGLEVHCQLKTNTKIFCGCSARFGARPNAQVCPVCLGLPGALPVLNRRAVELTLRVALATGSSIQPRSRFARKSYFYPDLPKGYQITQYDEPVAFGGRVEFDLEGHDRTVRLARIHLEEDAGKSTHLEERPLSLVDFNRSGVPLVEIVSEPEIRTPVEAAEYLRALRALVRALDVSDGNLEEGSLRCDANVSMRPAGSKALGAKAEIKNMNSFRAVERAVAYEIDRQTETLRSGGRIARETRQWNADRGVTEPMRGKEEAFDYRYFHDPDLPPLEIRAEWVDEVRRAMPELPRQRRARFQREYALSAYDARVLTAERELGDYFEATVRGGAKPKPAANFVMTEILGRVPDPRSVADAPVTPEGLAVLLGLLESGTISGKIAKAVLTRMWETGGTAEEIVSREGFAQLSDESQIERQCREVLGDFPREVGHYRAGDKRIFGHLVGQVMKATSGRANPKMVNDILRKLLDD